MTARPRPDASPPSPTARSATPRWPGPGELGATHADFRFERVRYQHLGVRDGALQGASDSEDLGFAVRVVHRGAWGFASGVVLTPDEAVAGRRDRRRGGPGRRRDDHHAGRAGPRAGLRRRHLGLVLRRQPARGARRREGRAAGRLDRAAAPRRRRRPRLGATCCRCRRTSTTPTSPAPAPPSSGSGCMPGFEAMGAGADTFDSMASIAPAGGPRLGVPHQGAADGGWDWDAELDEVPELLAEKLKAPERRGRHLRPGDPPLQPVADHPRVDRPRHRARPGPGLRGQLRRHLVRDLRPARHPALRLARS